MKAAHENAVIFTDPKKCLGCHSCEVACALAHPPGAPGAERGSAAAASPRGQVDLHSAVLAGLALWPRVRVVAAGAWAVPVQCRQCEDAPCALACPNGAIRQEGGTVQIQEAHCMGCKLCALVCPFGAVAVRALPPPPPPARTHRGVARKCDLCAGRAEGPACVEACPTRAVRLVDLDSHRLALQEARAAELAASETRIAQHRE